MPSLNYLIYWLLLFGNLLTSIESANYTTPQICLNLNQNKIYDKLKCDNKLHGLFITLVEYSNDYLNICNSTDHHDEFTSANSNNNKTTFSISALEKSPSIKINNNLITNKCVAYATSLLAEFCNGKLECLIKLEQAEFKYGFNGANCDFKAIILTISYECIPVKFEDSSIPKYDICSDKPILHPMLGFIHSPNYPNNYDSSKFCQITIKMDQSDQRIEIYLIFMELEELSKRTSKPTDYLQIENGQKYLGKKQFVVIYNDTKDALIVFNSDTWFTKKGFFLYFNVIKDQEKLDLIEEEIEPYDDLIHSFSPKSTNQTEKISLLKNDSVSINDSITLNQQHGKEELLKLSNSNNKSIIENSTNIQSSNQSFPILKETRINVNDLVSMSKLKSEKSNKRNYKTVEQQQSSSNSFISDHTTKAMITLLILIIILSGIIFFLIFSAKQRIKAETMLYKASMQAESRYAEENSILGAYAIAPNGSNFFMNPNIIYQLNGNKNVDRRCENSMSHLLLNTSLVSNPIIESFKLKQMVAINSQEVYEYITDPNDKTKSIKKQVNSTNKNQSDNKLNEYCYIPATTLNELNQNDNLDGQNILLKIPTSNGTSSCTSLSPSISPNLKSSDSLITSTPSVPKTMPPAIARSSNINEEMNEKSLNNNAKRDLNEQFKTDNTIQNDDKTKCIDETEENYQVPSNLPKIA